MKTLLYFLAASALMFNMTISYGQDAVINILHINDTHANYAKGHSRDENLKGTFGGMAKAASVMGYARQQDPEALLFHAGDYFMGDLFFYLNFGVPELMWMKQMGFNAATIGNHEFDVYTETLIQSIQYAFADGGFPLLSANLTALDETGEALKSLLKDRDIMTVHGVKIGVFGLTSPEANFSSLPAPSIWVESDNVDVLANIAYNQVESLKAEGAQVIIFLSHLGLGADQLIGSMIPGIDIIIGGHDHFAMQEPIVLDGLNKTYIVQAGAFFENVGSIQAEVKNGKLESFNYQLIPLDENIPDEPNTLAMIDGLIESLPDEQKALFTQPIAMVEETFNEFEPNLMVLGNHSTPIGCLISNALKDFGKTDIGFTVGGMSAQPLYQGLIVPQDIVKMLGYGINSFDLIGYNVVSFDLPGAGLKAGIEFCLGSIGQNDEYFPQVAGINFEYYVDKLPRLKSIKINGEEIQDDKMYSLTTNYAIFQIMGFLGIPIENVIVYEEDTEFKVLTNYAISQELLNPVDFSNGRCKCEAATIENDINVVIEPDHYYKDMICINEEVLFNPILDKIGNFTYIWTINNEIIGNEKNLKHKFTMPGQYEIKLSVAGDNKSGSGSLVITITDQCPVTIIADNFSTCKNSNPTINPIVFGGKGAYSYDWKPISDFVDNTAKNATVKNPIYSKQFDLVATDLLTNQKAIEHVFMTVLESPSVSFNKLYLYVKNSDPVDLTDEDVITINVNGGKLPYQYKWTNNNGIQIDPTNINPPLGSSKYYLTVTDANGCISMEKRLIIFRSNGKENYEEIIPGLTGIGYMFTYPNPVTDNVSVYVDFNSEMPATLKILNLLGNEVFNLSIDNTKIFEQQINVSFLSIGVYTIVIETSENTYAKQFIKH